ncbi:MAG TPA: type II toxin-antitoxin system RelE/ParE family toxin [Rhodanobacteraceae bacterium]|nr:type II toxin-antitoxin system RelE/ParE family toxin [Rhodanobacteraceae bacterium]
MRDLRRLRGFLEAKSPDAAQRAGDAIRRGVALLADQPQIGRPVQGAGAGTRERLIEFGSSGYAVLYRVDRGGVTIVAIRHQKEVGY